MFLFGADVRVPQQPFRARGVGLGRLGLFLGERLGLFLGEASVGEAVGEDGLRGEAGGREGKGGNKQRAHGELPSFNP